MLGKGDWAGLFVCMGLDLHLANWAASISQMPSRVPDETASIEVSSYGGRRWLPVHWMCAAGFFLLWQTDGGGRLGANLPIYESAIALHTIAQTSLVVWASAYYTFRKGKSAVAISAVGAFLQLAAVALTFAQHAPAAMLILTQLPLHAYITCISLSSSMSPKAVGPSHKREAPPQV
jgi:hypothetical protein